MAAEDAIRVLVADDHALVRRGVRDMLGLSPRMTVVAEAANGEEALTLYRQHRPDVGIIDLRMPVLGGVEVIRALCQEQPDARLIALSNYKGDEDIHRALEAGALAFLIKTVLAEELIATVEAAHLGHKRLGPEVTRRLERRMGGPGLTPRELEVLEQMVRGRGNEEISAALGITVETVKVHVKRVLGKLAVSNRGQAVSTALARGIVHLD